MSSIFEVEDVTGRLIHLSEERWTHINREHPELANLLDEIKDALMNPIRYDPWEFDANIRYFYRYYKYRKSAEKYLLVIVKYLN